MENAAQIQRDYYHQTASKYDKMHLHEDDEHYFALHFMSSMIELHGIRSILDVGAGTGRTVAWLKERFPDLIIKGVEPVKALREVGYKKGLSEDDLLPGDGNSLDFEDGAFDLVCEFGMLHHVPEPGRVVSEMLRTAKTAIFISDSNNLAQGSRLVRIFKQILYALNLWELYNLIRTRGKRYQINEGDGLFYSYSVIKNFKQIKNACRIVHVLNTKNTSVNHYRAAVHVALFGLKK
jgi:ubiquinone/menaquinone biosynthesis C-methylase UbiE